MPDETTTTDKMFEESTTTTDTTGTVTAGTETPDEAPFDRDRAMQTIHKLREAEKEGKRAAKDLADAKAKLQAIEDAQKSDAEKQAERLAGLEAERATWDAERRDLGLRLAVFAKQAELGIADGDLAIAALDRNAIEWDDAGQPANLDDVLNDLLERKPILRGKAAVKKPGSTDAREGANAGPKPNLTAEELEMAAQLDMTPERYVAFKEVRTSADYAELRKNKKD